MSVHLFHHVDMVPIYSLHEYIFISALKILWLLEAKLIEYSNKMSYCVPVNFSLSLLNWGFAGGLSPTALTHPTHVMN